jgi:hypothetical protein
MHITRPQNVYIGRAEAINFPHHHPSHHSRMSAESESKSESVESSFYALKADLPGTNKVYDFNHLKGKVVLVVNTASKWWAAFICGADELTTLI